MLNNHLTTTAVKKIVEIFEEKLENFIINIISLRR